MRKHGAEAHFVRPDSVYRTSVLQAIPGYQPVSNAYSIASRFTAAPYFATTVQAPVQQVAHSLQGFGAPSLPGLLGFGFARPTLLGLGQHSMRQLSERSLRGFAGPLTGWEQLKLKWNAYRDRLKAMRALKQGGAAAMAATAALTPAVAKPDGSVVAALPDVPANAPEALDYGQGPARDGMQKVATAITSGAVTSGDQVTMPLVAKTQYTAGNQIAPQAYSQVADLAAMVQAEVPGYVGQHAYRAAMGRWNGVRQWWWD